MAMTRAMATRGRSLTMRHFSVISRAADGRLAVFLARAGAPHEIACGRRPLTVAEPEARGPIVIPSQATWPSCDGLLVNTRTSWPAAAKARFNTAPT